MRIPIEVSRKDFEKLKKLYKGTSNNVMFFVDAKKVYVNYFGDIISLQEANERFAKTRENLTKKTKNSIRN